MLANDAIVKEQEVPFPDETESQIYDLPVKTPPQPSLSLV